MTTQAENIATLERQTSKPNATPRGEAGAMAAEFMARRIAAETSAKRNALVAQALDVVASAIKPKAGGYANARTTRLNAYSMGLTGSPDLALDPNDLANLRRASQESVRNNPVARAIVRCTVGVVAPERMSFQARTGDPKYNALVEEAFSFWWNERADFFGKESGPMLLRQVLEAALVDGDIGINLVYSDRGPQLQLVAGERIQSGSGIGDLQEQHGVYHDANGRVTGYRVFDWTRWGALEMGSGRLLPSDFFILAKNWRHARPGQTRGEPVLAGSLHLIEQLSEFKAATLVAARVGACFAALILSNAPAEKQAAMLAAVDDAGNAPRNDDGTSNTQVIRPGMMMHLKTGEDVKQLEPKFPSDAFGPFVVSLLREIGADCGLPLELFMYDTTETTFYGGKASVALAYHETIATWQIWLRKIMTRIYRWWSDTSVATGFIPDHPDRLRHVWVAAPTPAYDEKEAVETGVLKVSNNLMSKADLCQQLTGQDLEEVANRRAAEVAREKALNIPPPAMPGAQANVVNQNKPARAGEVAP